MVQRLEADEETSQALRQPPSRAGRA
jgi:hypothetical protein